MRIAYFDCFSGAAGDMILGALIDAGADLDAVRAGIKGLGLDGYTLDISKITKQGFAATRVDVALHEAAAQPHRHLSDIERIINAGDLPDPVCVESLAIFRRLAEAEARVHGTSVQKVHFHEVGAVDAIVDIVGACFAKQSLGIECVICSPVPTGSGTVKCAHGIMPVPAPATAELLKGVPIAHTDETGELLTPTGAAILATWADSFGPPPAMELQAVGTGAGSRDGVSRPNVLRVLIGRSNSGQSQDQVVLLETNLDDATPQLIAYCMDRLLEAGALDAYTLPIQMKKSRLGSMLCVICEPQRATEFEQIILAETPTLGIRRRLLDRVIVPRRIERVETRFGSIAMKVAERKDGETATPEFEDCAAAARQHNKPLLVVIEAAIDAWRTHQRR